MPFWLLLCIGGIAWLVRDQQESVRDEHASDALDPDMPPFLRTQLLEALGRELQADQFERLARAMSGSGYPRAAQIFQRRAREVLGSTLAQEQEHGSSRGANNDALLVRVSAESNPSVLLAMADVLDLTGQRVAADQARQRARGMSTRAASRPQPGLSELLDSLEPYDEDEICDEGDELEQDSADAADDAPVESQKENGALSGDGEALADPQSEAANAQLAGDGLPDGGLADDGLADHGADDEDFSDADGLTPQQQADAAIAAAEELVWRGHDAE
jgi:hypothetical protein